MTETAVTAPAPIGGAPVRPLRVATATYVLAPVGGVEVCVAEDALALVERGHAVDVMYRESGVQAPVLTAGGVSIGGPFEFQFDPRRALSNLVSFVRSGFALRRRRPDLLWLNRPENIIWAQIASRIARVPLVVHLHHYPNYRLQKQMMVGVERFVSVSHYMKQVWVDRGIPADKIDVVHNALPYADYPFGDAVDARRAKERIGLDPEVEMALFIGRVMKKKGVLTVLDAWRRLALDPKKAVLVVLGDFPEPDAEIQAAMEAMPAGSLRYIPNQPDPITYFHAADVVVTPSIEPEAFGRVVAEGLATGRPVIGGNDGGMGEILIGDMSRFAVPPLDVERLAETIRATLPWREQEPDLGLRCRASIEANFPHSAHIDALEKIFSAVAPPQRSARAPRNRKQ